MVFKPEEIAAAANQAISKLKRNGQIGYVEKIKLPLIDTTSVNCAPVEELGGMIGSFLVVPPNLENAPRSDAGEFTAYVVWDGKAYDCSYYCIENLVQFGNMSMSNPEEENTGEPFVFSFDKEAGMGVLVTTTEGSHSFTMAVLETVYKPMNDRYLPKGDEQPVFSPIEPHIDINDIVNGGQHTLEITDSGIDDIYAGGYKFFVAMLNCDTNNGVFYVSVMFSKYETNYVDGYLSQICNWKPNSTDNTYYMLQKKSNGRWNLFEYTVT